MKVRLHMAVLLTAAALVAAASPGSARAQQALGFGEEPSRDLVSRSFSDREISSLITTLDALLSSRKTNPWIDDARQTLATFTGRLQAGYLSAAQEATVLGHLSQLARSHPEGRPLFDTARHVVSALTVGKTAPDITGRDLTGNDLRLADYRGKVVVVLFSGEWCGICRSQYPYERLLLELYKNWPFAILGVNSDKDPAAANKAYLERGLTFPSWSDTGPDHGPRGPIATAWGVNGWPTNYVLDGAGVIRFVNLREEDLLKGVRQLLFEQQTTTAAQHRRQTAVPGR